MRVIHAVSGRLFGGIEQMLVTLARGRDITPDVEIEFAVAAPGRLDEELRALGVTVHALGDVRLSRPASLLQARSRLASAIDHGSDPIVICHAPWAFAILGPVARRTHVPLVLWQHDHATGTSLVERWARSTTADLVICNSLWTSRTAAALQPALRATGAASRAPRVAVIHPPVMVTATAAASRADLRRELTTGADDVVIMSASRMEPWKGQLSLLRALGRLAADQRWTAWIAGAAQRPHEQQYADALIAEARALGIDARVRFLGERRDVPALMQAADLFCQANEGPEPFGIVFAEALLSGVPVVTADLGGAPEIVADTCGRLVSAGDLGALAAALAQLIDDGGLRRRLGAAGPAHAAARVAPDVVLPALARTLATLGERAAA